MKYLIKVQTIFLKPGKSKKVQPKKKEEENCVACKSGQIAVMKSLLQVVNILKIFGETIDVGDLLTRISNRSLGFN